MISSSSAFGEGGSGSDQLRNHCLLPDPGQGKAPGSRLYLYLTKCNFLFPRGINERFTEKLKASWHSSDGKGHFDELSANKTKTYAID